MILNAFLNPDIAGSYDTFYETKMGHRIDVLEKQAIENMLPVAGEDPILELGCGTGHWSAILSEKGFRVQALDISDAMLSKATMKNIPNVSFQKGDASLLTFNDESFETVISIAMLEFITDVPKVVKEMFRVLKPGGVLILGCLNLHSQIGKTKDNDEIFRNARFFTREELRNLLSQFGDVQISESVYLTPTYELLDGSIEENSVEGVFLAIQVYKTT